jgi:predicted NBD/HSP70 family sugar kinase
VNEPQDFLVFDVGGTHLRVGRYRRDAGGLVDRRTLPSPSAARLPGAAPDALCAALSAALREAAVAVFGDREPRRIGLAFAGPIDSRGVALASPTLWGPRLPRAVDLPELLHSHWPRADVRVLNDVTAAGYRWARPAGVDAVVAIGSGIGNKVFVDGVPLLGVAARGGELGHWRVDRSPRAPLCDCGGRGHLGALASGRAVAGHVERLARELPSGVGGRDLLDAADEAERIQRLAEGLERTDPFALAVVRALARPLGSALSALHLGVGVERFVLFGGLARALGEPYRRLVAEAAAESAWPNGMDWWAGIELAGGDDDDGLLGMGRYLDTLD